MIDATWYQDYTERTTNSILQLRKGSSRSEDTLYIILRHVAPCSAALFAFHDVVV